MYSGIFYEQWMVGDSDKNQKPRLLSLSKIQTLFSPTRWPWRLTELTIVVLVNTETGELPKSVGQPGFPQICIQILYPPETRILPPSFPRNAKKKIV